MDLRDSIRQNGIKTHSVLSLLIGFEITLYSIRYNVIQKVIGEDKIFYVIFLRRAVKATNPSPTSNIAWVSGSGMGLMFVNTNDSSS